MHIKLQCIFCMSLTPRLGTAGLNCVNGGSYTDEKLCLFWFFLVVWRVFWPQLLCFKVHERKSYFIHMAGDNWSLETFPNQVIINLWHSFKWWFWTKLFDWLVTGISIRWMSPSSEGFAMTAFQKSNDNKWNEVRNKPSSMLELFVFSK